MIEYSNGLESDTVQVTFTLPTHGQDDGPISVVGDFNDWDLAATPMTRRGDLLSATVTLRRGRYRFRYLTETGWFNDAHADDYERDKHGIQDGVLDLAVHAATA